MTDEAVEAVRFLGDDALFQALVVQRSRAYVRKSQLAARTEATAFPARQPPKVAPYELKKTYGKLLDMVEAAFEKESPLFYLPIFYRLNYSIGPAEEREPHYIATCGNRRRNNIGGTTNGSEVKTFASPTMTVGS